MSATAEQTLVAQPEALEDVPSFPPVAGRLMRLVSGENEDFSYKDVADLIRADAAFAVEVLRLANSPVFGFRYEIKDIPHAVAVLGLNRLRAIVTTLAMTEFLAGAGFHESVQRSWRHNLATALACETLAGAFWVDGGLGYTAGLIHDIGLLALVAKHPDIYAGLMNSPCQEPEKFLVRERELLGLDHCLAGEWLLTHWDLPIEFRDVAANHHRPPGEISHEVTSLVALGCETASLAGFPIWGGAAVWNLERIVSRIPEKLRTRYRGKLEDFPIEVATKINSFDCDFLT